jgi:hypothetical protein
VPPTDGQLLLSKEIGSLVQRLRTWTPTRWAAAADPWGTRADLGRHLAQCFADLAAGLEGQPLRGLPVLQPDLLVADQLAVTGDDLLRCAPPDELCRETVDHLLAHRFELLDEEPPSSLGGPDAVRRGRQVCATS